MSCITFNSKNPLYSLYFLYYLMRKTFHLTLQAKKILHPLNEGKWRTEKVQNFYYFFPLAADFLSVYFLMNIEYSQVVFLVGVKR